MHFHLTAQLSNAFLISFGITCPYVITYQMLSNIINTFNIIYKFSLHKLKIMNRK